MPISERMLRKWRGEALKFKKQLQPTATTPSTVVTVQVDRVLALTQELLDQALLRKETTP